MSIPRRPPGTPAPLSFQQLRLWFLDRLVGADARGHNMSVGLRFSGPLDVPRLERGLGLVLARHDVLRSTVDDAGDEPIQVVVPVPDAPVEHLDLSALPPAARDTALDRVVADRARVVFDLRTGPLFRLLLVRLADAEHLLLVTLHHIVADGWSGGVLSAELAECYQALGTGRPPALPDLPVQYADYAYWQRQWLQGPVLARLLDYWRDRLGDAPVVLDLPGDRPRPPVQTFRGGAIRFTLPRAVADGVDGLSRRAGVSRFMTGLAAFAAVLSRWSDQADILVGTPVANRTRRELERLCGFFANTLALRVDLRGDPSFTELLDRVRESVSADFAHQDVPFEKLVEERQPPRDLSRHPLFQVLFSWQDEPMGGFRLGDLDVTPVPMHSGNAQFDVSLYAHRGAGGEVFCVLEYAEDLFDHATAERLTRQYVTLLGAAATDPARPVSRLPLLDDAERTRVLAGVNDTARRWRVDRPAVELVDAQVRRTPEAVALICAGETVTYAALARRAADVAGQLSAAGVGPGDLVGLCLPRGIDLVTALLGVLRSGAGYLPLDVANPPERHALLLADAGATAVVTDPARAALFAGRTVVVAGEPTSAAGRPVPPHPAGIAYVLYTSGSTGRPKGVAVDHRSFVDFLHAVREAPGLGPDDVVLAVSTVCFDIALFELIAPLTVGARVVVAREHELRDGNLLRELIDRHRVTVLDATPATWQLLIGAGWSGGRPLKVVSTGEALAPELAHALLDRSDDVWNMYGPTEATVWAAWHRVRRDEQPVPIGRPVPNARLYVLDPTGEPVPIGVPGELYIGGVGVTRGYLNRPGLTAASFVPDPYGPPGARLYRTGDLVRHRPQGTIEFIGRVDHQVKVRGYRIEPGEIEAVLRTDPDVAEVAVVAEGEDVSLRRLVAYVVPRSGTGAELGVARLRQRCTRQLPAYMVPARYVLLDAMPRNANGKTDRRALPAAAGRALEPAGESLTGSARLVAEVWCEVLGLPRVGRHENFFDLGGHSFLAVQLQRRLGERFGREFTLLSLFENPTVAGVARLIDAGPSSAPHRPAAPAPDPQYGRRRRAAIERRLDARRPPARPDPQRTSGISGRSAP